MSTAIDNVAGPGRKFGTNFWLALLAVALLIVVIISCVNEDLNVGFLAIGFAIIVAGVWGGTAGAKVLSYFPTSLFMILVGVTFMFGMAQTNGTMEKLTAYSVRLCKGNTTWIPFIIFMLLEKNTFQRFLRNMVKLTYMAA